MVGTVLIIFGVWLWWSLIITSKSRVFYSMLKGNLSNFGATKISKQMAPNGTTTQIAQAQFGGRNLVDITTDIDQDTVDGAVEVTTQTLSTPTEDFVRYKQIDIPQTKDKQADLSPLIGKWGRTSSLEGGGAAFSEATYGVILAGNLPKNDRDELFDMMKGKEVYKTDFSKTKKEKLDGRDVYVYEVEVNVQEYAKLLKKYDEVLGLNRMEQLAPEQYKDEQPIKITLTVDLLSRQLVRVKYIGGDQEESLKSQGIRGTTNLPTDAITRTELEGKLQELLSKAQQ